MKERILFLCASLAVGSTALFLVLSGCLPWFNQPPVAPNRFVEVAAGGTVAIDCTATDPDGGPGALTYTLVTAPANGALGGVLPNVTYTPAGGFTGCDQFTYSASDGAATSNVATVRIAVANQSPTANNVTINDVPTGQSTTLTLSASDPGNCPRSPFVNWYTQPANGAVDSPSGLTVRYTPNTDFVGTDTFTYTVSDGVRTSNVATATVNVRIIGPTNRNIYLTLQNAVTDRYIHYHLHLIAFREDVAPGDESRYESFGYRMYTSPQTIGCYTFPATVARPLFYYYHQNGRFRTEITDTSRPLLSGIQSAVSATQPRLDPFFAGRVVPVPSLILFHDPRNTVPSPFDQNRNSHTINSTLANVTNCTASCEICSRASWYYVTATDVPSGFPGLGCTRGRDPSDNSRILRYFRVPAETQDTVCWDCSSAAGNLPPIGVDTSAVHWLHNTAVGQAVWPNPAGSTSLQCFEYYLGSFVTYTFTNAGDTAPAGTSPPPSLKWEVRTPSGIVLKSPW